MSVTRKPSAKAAAKPAVATAEAAKVSLDLDALEREGEGAGKEPFTARHGGRVYTMIDPQEVDWQDLLACLNNPTLFFKYTLAGASRNEFLSTPMPTWKVNKLMADYLDHYGLPSLPNAFGLPG